MTEVLQHFVVPALKHRSSGAALGALLALAACHPETYRIALAPSLRPVDPARPLVVFSQIRGEACGRDALAGALRDLERLDGVDGYLEIAVDESGSGDRRCARVTAVPFRYGGNTDLPVLRAAPPNTAPVLVPGRDGPRAVPALIDAALSATLATDVVMPAPEGLNFGATNHAPVTACSCGVPSAEIAALTSDLIGFFQRRAAQQQAYIMSTIGLRFVQAARAHLSPSYGRDTCMIEVPTLLGTPHARETLDAYHDFLFHKYSGRPHWGQVNDMPGERLRVLYPELDAFLEAFRVLNPKGFFDNAFTEQMGFRRL